MKLRTRKIIGAVMAVAVAFAMLPGMAAEVKAATANVVEEGKAGAGITYKLFEYPDGSGYHLELTGKGDMYNYSSLRKMVQKGSYLSKVRSIAIGKGITSVGDYAFYDVALASVQEIQLCEGLQSIGDHAFGYYNGAYIRVPSTVKEIKNSAFTSYKGRYFTYPSDLSYLGWNNGYLERTARYYPGSKSDWASKLENMNGVTAAVVIHENNSVNWGAVDPMYNDYSDYVPWETETTASPDFSDVEPGSILDDALTHLHDTGMNVGGIDETHFAPGNPLSRAQAVTFLKGFAGEGDVSGNAGFSDVPIGCWYEKAVVWAVNKRYTSGVGGNRFNPEGLVTRAQAVTFLRTMANGRGGRSTFNDVPRNSWYFDAVAWAADNGITGGIGNGNFGPHINCTREQFIIFLYRLSQAQ